MTVTPTMRLILANVARWLIDPDADGAELRRERARLFDTLTPAECDFVEELAESIFGRWL